LHKLQACGHSQGFPLARTSVAYVPATIGVICNQSDGYISYF